MSPLVAVAITSTPLGMTSAVAPIDRAGYLGRHTPRRMSRLAGHSRTHGESATSGPPTDSGPIGDRVFGPIIGSFHT